MNFSQKRKWGFEQDFSKLSRIAKSYFTAHAMALFQLMILPYLIAAPICHSGFSRSVSRRSLLVGRPLPFSRTAWGNGLGPSDLGGGGGLRSS